jgi:hypothetical protein
MPGDNSDDVLIDRSGNGTDDKVRFELERKVLGRKLIGLRFHSHEEFEPGRAGATLRFCFDNGESLMVACDEEGMAILLSMDGSEAPAPTQVM